MQVPPGHQTVSTGSPFARLQWSDGPWYLMPSDQQWMRTQPESRAVSGFLELMKRINKKAAQQMPMTLRQKSVFPRVEVEGGSVVIYTERSLWMGQWCFPVGTEHFARGGKQCWQSCVYPLSSPVTALGGPETGCLLHCLVVWRFEVKEREREGEMGEGKEEERYGLWINKYSLKNLESNIVLSSACSKNYFIYF